MPPETPLPYLPGRPVFVGREVELRALTEQLDGALAGQGSFVLIAGEPGIGKTRLAEGLAERAEARGATVVWGRCYEDAGAPAFWPWLEALRAVIRRVPAAALRSGLGDGAADAAQLLPELHAALPDVTTSTAPYITGNGHGGEEAGAAARFRLFDSLAGLLRGVAAVRPLVLVLDDLHWADAASALLLEFLARAPVPGLLVAGTYRDVEVQRGHPLYRVLGDLVRRPFVTRIRLTGLGDAEVGRLAELAAQTSPSQELVRALVRDTEGNPLFVGEVLRLLAAEGLLSHGTQEPPGAIRLPQTVREVINRRLDVLPVECLRTLSLASTFGREFSVDALERIGEVPGDALFESLDQAEAAHLIAATSGSPGGYRFTHALIRETLYADLSAARRTQLHRRVAEALEPAWVDLPEHYAELAAHFSQAATADAAAKALVYARGAAKHAWSVLAFEEAVRMFELALRALDRAAPGDREQRFALLIELARAANLSGDGKRGQQTSLQAAALARASGSGRRLAEAALVYDDRVDVGVVDHTWIALLDEALAGLLPEERQLRSRVSAMLARASYYADNARCVELARDAVNLGRETGDAETLALALTHLLSVLVRPDESRERLRLATELVEIARRGADPATLALAHSRRALALLERGRLTEADLEVQAELRVGEKLRLPYYQWRPLAWAATRATLEGRFSEAERLVGEAASIGREREVPGATQHFAVQMFALRREQGRLSELIPALEGLTRQFPGLPVWRAALALACVHAERIDDARRQFEMVATDNFAGLPVDINLLITLALLAPTCAALGDGRRALQLYELLQPYHELNVVAALSATANNGAVSRELGLLADAVARSEAGQAAASEGGTAIDWWARAADHFEHALSMHDAMGARPLVAHTRHEYARSLLGLGRIADARGQLPRADAGDVNARAATLLDAAIDGARELGMARLLNQAVRLRETAFGPSRPLAERGGTAATGTDPTAVSLPDGLTAREAEVLGLLAAGHSNREIADALVLTINTVQTHLQRIYAKIGARGRSEAVAYTVRHGLALPSGPAL